MDEKATHHSAMDFGRFQVLTCVASFLFMVFNTFITLSGMFLNVRPYNCSSQLQQQQEISTNLTYSSVDEDIGVRWSEHQGFKSSLSIQYELCSRGTGDLTTVAYFVGTIVGSLITGPVSDMIGRMPCFLIGQLLTALASLASNYLPTFSLHLVSRCLAGFFMMFAQCSIQVYGCEVHSPEYRSRFLASWSTGVSAGTLVAALLAHITRDHQLYVLISCTAAAVPLLVSVFLPESPAWLAAKGHRERAETALRRIKSINGRCDSQGKTSPQQMEAMIATLSSNANIHDEGDAVNSSRNTGWRAWNCQLVRLLSILGIHGIFLGFNSYGFYFVMVSIIPDVCLYAALLGATQLPYAFVLNIIPRRSGLVVLCLISGLMALAFGAVAHFLPDQDFVLAGLGVVGCFCGTAAFNVLVTVSAEFFPTAIRNTGLGLCTFCLRCGSAVSPLANFLPGALLQSILLACPLLLSNVLLGLVLAGVINLQNKKTLVEEQLEKQKSIELDM